MNLNSRSHSRVPSGVECCISPDKQASSRRESSKEFSGEDLEFKINHPCENLLISDTYMDDDLVSVHSLQILE